jgi:regulator of RNase E activity RraB
MIVLAFDIESTIAIGASVVDEEGKELVTLVQREYDS